MSATIATVGQDALTDAARYAPTLIRTPIPASIRRKPSRSATLPQMTRHIVLITSAVASTRPASAIRQPARASTVGNTALKLNCSAPNASVIGKIANALKLTQKSVDWVRQTSSLRSAMATKNSA